MVHVEQVLVHERVVAGHFAIELARLVAAVALRTERGRARAPPPGPDRPERRRSGRRSRARDTRARRWAGARGRDRGRRCICRRNHRPSRDSRISASRPARRPDAAGPGDGRSGPPGRRPPRSCRDRPRSGRRRSGSRAPCPASARPTTGPDTRNPDGSRCAADPRYAPDGLVDARDAPLSRDSNAIHRHFAPCRCPAASQERKDSVARPEFLYKIAHLLSSSC